MTWNDRLIARFEALDDAARATLRIQLSFAPAPLDLATVVGFRLCEETLHGWDVHVSRDRKAALDPRATTLLLGQLPAMAALLGQPLGTGHIAIAVEAHDPTLTLVLETDEDALTLEPGSAPAADGRLQLPAEALVRLVAGRLPAEPPQHRHPRGRHPLARRRPPPLPRLLSLRRHHGNY